MGVLEDRIGVSLWTMQSTRTAPRNPTAAYRDLREDARLVEALGFHSLWTGEHRGWYDGWCPAPLHALAGAASVTRRLRLGTAMLLLAQHDAASLHAATTTFRGLFGDRLELGVALGYRDAEFDMLGLRRDRRGRLMDERLAELAALESEAGDAGPPLWIGGMAGAAIERAARAGASLLLPQTLGPAQLARAAAAYRAAGGTGQVGITQDVWVAADADEQAWFRAALAQHFREEIGAWWALDGELGFARPELLARQLDRIDGSAVVGAPDVVAGRLTELFEAGAELLLLRVAYDFADRRALHAQLERLAGDVAPRLTAAAVSS